MKGQYVKPENVCSPKKTISGVKILLDQGKGKDKFSIASLIWDNKSRIGIRWNGDDYSVGQPQSHGVPTWFILPKEIALSYAETINNVEMKAAIARVKE